MQHTVPEVLTNQGGISIDDVPSGWRRISQDFLEEDIQVAEKVLKWPRIGDEWSVLGVISFNQWSLPEFHTRASDDSIVDRKVREFWDGTRLQMYIALTEGKGTAYRAGDFSRAALSTLLALPFAQGIERFKQSPVAEAPPKAAALAGTGDLSPESLVRELRLQARESKLFTESLLQAASAIESLLNRESNSSVIPRGIDLLRSDTLCERCNQRRAKIEYVRSREDKSGYAVCISCNSEMLEKGEMTVSLAKPERDISSEAEIRRLSASLAQLGIEDSSNDIR